MPKDKVDLEDLLEKTVEEKSWRQWYREPQWRNIFRGVGLVFLTIYGYVLLGLRKLRHKKVE